MGRSIVTAAHVTPDARARGGPGDQSQPAPSADTYNDMLLKLIPAEVIGIYLAMQTILNNAEAISRHTGLVVFVFGVLATFFYLRVVLKVSNPVQLLISAGAFCVWAYSMSSTEQLSFYNGTYAGLLLIGYTFIAPKIPMGGKS
jgi:FtsH-binding integral membrane protein